MSSKEWIELSVSIFSFVLAVISVITVIITIRQNKKMIRNSTRPYVVALAQIANFQRPNFYLVIKNHGKSAAIIDVMKCSLDLSKIAHEFGRVPFDDMEGTLLAPGQSIINCLDANKINKMGVSSFSVELEYHDNVGKYKEVFPINFKTYLSNVSTRASTKDKELKIISYTLQDMVEKQF